MSCEECHIVLPSPNGDWICPGGCRYCLRCAYAWWRTNTNTKFSCPGCLFLLTSEDIRRQGVHAALTALRLSGAAAAGDVIFFCPTDGCTNWVACSPEFGAQLGKCTSCGGPPSALQVHLVQAAQREKQLEEALEKDEKWKADNCRQCPKCQRVLAKSGGCDAMKCGGYFHGGNAESGCGALFRWCEAKPYVNLSVAKGARPSYLGTSREIASLSVWGIRGGDNKRELPPSRATVATGGVSEASGERVFTHGSRLRPLTWKVDPSKRKGRPSSGTKGGKRRPTLFETSSDSSDSSDSSSALTSPIVSVDPVKLDTCHPERPFGTKRKRPSLSSFGSAGMQSITGEVETSLASGASDGAHPSDPIPPIGLEGGSDRLSSISTGEGGGAASPIPPIPPIGLEGANPDDMAALDIRVRICEARLTLLEYV
jgi:hypothetical protein